MICPESCKVPAEKSRNESYQKKEKEINIYIFWVPSSMWNPNPNPCRM